jgi:hypothetical protein
MHITFVIYYKLPRENVWPIYLESATHLHDFIFFLHYYAQT